MNGWRPFSRFSEAKWVWVRGFLSEIAGELQTTFVGHKKLVETCVDGIWVSAIMNGWRPFPRFWVSQAKWADPKVLGLGGSSQKSPVSYKRLLSGTKSWWKHVSTEFGFLQ